MDLIITTSQHSKDGFIKSTYDKIDEKTKQKVDELALQKPIEVLFEGIDTNVYKRTKEIHDTVKDQLSMVKESFAYLFVGHWLKGTMGQDRKDIGMLIKTFAETYKNKARHNRPALILKTSGATFSIVDRDEQMQKIQQIL